MSFLIGDLIYASVISFLELHKYFVSLNIYSFCGNFSLFTIICSSYLTLKNEYTEKIDSTGKRQKVKYTSKHTKFYSEIY